MIEILEDEDPSSDSLKSSYNTVNQEVDKLDLSFSNTVDYDTSLHFCYQKKELWAVKNQVFYTYDLEKYLI